MKILFQSRTTLFSVPGGDTIQLLKTKQYLEDKYDIDIDISVELEPDVHAYDIVHVFNLMRVQETKCQVINAKRQNNKVALSTIYGLYTEYEKKAREGFFGKLAKVLTTWQIEYGKILMRAIRNNEFNSGVFKILVKGYKSSMKSIIKNVDIFLPNSESEMNRIKSDFPDCSVYNYEVIPNAVDLQVFDYKRTIIPEEIMKYSNCVLCVARFDGRKNQLNLIKAMFDLPYTLVLIGKPAPNHISYYNEAKKYESRKIVFIDHIDHELLPAFYKISKVHVLPSWMETPGLSSIEAGIMNCNIVVTKKGDAEDYFEEYAYYCEPDNIKSIKDAVKKAYEDEYQNGLSNLIRENYSWTNTAEKTFIAYKRIYQD